MLARTFLDDFYKVLILDSKKHILDIIDNITTTFYQNLRLLPAYSIDDARDVFSKYDVDMVLIDVDAVNGESHDFVAEIKGKKRALPVVAVSDTSKLSREEKMAFLHDGVTLFISVPFTAEEFVAVITNLLTLNEARKGLERVENITLALVRSIEARDTYTRGHAERTAFYSVKIFDEIGLEGEQRYDLYSGCILHDVGKISLPDTILKSGDPLSDEDMDLVKMHPTSGASICEGILLLKGALPVIAQHHERLDGSGYPNGLIERDINVLAQISSIADVYDALTSDRSYRKAMTQDQALEIMERDAEAGRLNSFFFEVLKKILEDESEGDITTIRV